MPANNPASGGPEIHRRRSQRVILTVPVIVARGASASRNTVSSGAVAHSRVFEEETSTLVVNAHGALVMLKAKVEAGDVLRMKNRRTQAEYPCKVIFIGQDEDGKVQIGVEFTTSAPEFWGIVFPTDNWAPSRLSARKPSATP